jgi:ABC-type sugar transport system permease subunit
MAPADRAATKATVIGWLLCLPALLIFGTFFVGPAIVGFYVSLFSWNGTSPHMSFVGLANYAAVLGDDRFWNAVRVTFTALAFMLAVKLPLALLLAVGLSAPGPIKRFFRVSLFLPYVLSTTMVAAIWIFLLDPYRGLVNYLLSVAGLDSWQQGWLGQGSTALPSVIIGGAWWTFGLYVVLFTAALAGIPSEFYDAARLETNSRLQVLFKITIPLLREQIFVACVMTTGGVLGFLTGFFLLLTGGGPAGRTETLGILGYFTAFRGLQFGHASAISVIVLALMFALIVLPTIRIVRGRVEY